MKDKAKRELKRKWIKKKVEQRPRRDEKEGKIKWQAKKKIEENTK